jgi:hypothetical protein
VRPGGAWRAALPAAFGEIPEAAGDVLMRWVEREIRRRLRGVRGGWGHGGRLPRGVSAQGVEAGEQLSRVSVMFSER